MSATLSYIVTKADFEFPNSELANTFIQNPTIEFVLDLDNADASETIFPTPHPDADPDAPSEIVRLTLNPEQYTITRNDDTTVSVTATVVFDTELLPNITKKEFKNWVEEEGGWATANINLGEDAEPLGEENIKLKLV